MDDALQVDAGDGQPLASPDFATLSFLRYRTSRDRADLEQALLACAPALHRCARQWFGPQDADDVVHDTFVVAIARAAAFDPGSKLLPWLLGILRHRGQSRHRRRWRSLAGNTDVGVRVEPADEHDPTAVVERDEWLARAWAGVSRLSSDYRLIVEAHLLRGVPLAEIAAGLGRPASTVRTQFQRGLSELRRRLPAPMLAGLAAMLAGRAAAQPSGAGPWGSAKRVGFAAGVGLVALTVAGWFVHASLRPAAVAQEPLSQVVGEAPEPQRPDPVRPADSRASLAAAPPRSLLVRLRFPDGTAAADMAVQLNAPYVVGELAVRRTLRDRVAYTDAEGQARFDSVSAGAIAVRVCDDNDLTVSDMGAVDKVVTCTVEIATWVRLQLLDVGNGQPIVGGTIMATSSNGMASPGYPAATTDVEGKVLFASTVSPLTVWAKAPGYQTSQVYLLRARASRGLAEPRVLRMTYGAHALRGRVLTDVGQPASGAVVAAWSDAATLVPPTYSVTNTAGEFMIDGLQPGPWSVVALAEGHAATIPHTQSSEDVLSLQVVRGGSVRVRIPTALVRQGMFASVADRSIDVRNRLSSGGGMIAADGSARAPHLRPGTYEVAVIEDGQRPFGEKLVSVAEGQEADVTFTEHDGPQWRVQVTDARGTPLKGCEVRTESPLDMLGSPQRRTWITDGAGVARLPLDEPAQPLFVYLPLGSSTNDLPAWTLPAVPPGSVSHVSLPDEAFASCSLRGFLPYSYRELSTRSALQISRAGGFRRLAAAIDGSFSALNLPPGDLRLELIESGVLCNRVLTVLKFRLEPGEQRDLGLLPTIETAEVALQIAPGGAGVPVRARLRNADGDLIEVLDLPPDRLLTRRLQIGDYSLGTVSARAEPVVQRFRVGAGRTVVHIDRTAGVPCRIEAREGAKRLPGPRLLATVSRDDLAGGGDFVLTRTPQRSWATEFDLQPGSYRVRVQSGCGAQAEATLVVDASAPTISLVVQMP